VNANLQVQLDALTELEQDKQELWAECITPLRDRPGRVERLVRELSMPTLEEMLASVTPGMLHGEVDWGRPVGKERFWEDD